ncbi:hypothetical protein ACFVUY_38000 [Kitasatospora sp. NPDC058063]|uniref:hypothetical protein n=1 Tax=unclassified Kitasatospora TaxID=2633591 RepID=UPI0036DE2F0E
MNDDDDAAPDAIFSDAGLKSLTNDKRQIHGKDALHYEQIADRMSAHLSQLHIDGDGTFSKQWRAWKVSRHARKMGRLSRRIAKKNQAFYSAFNNNVTKVPEKREKKAAMELQKAQQPAQLPNGQASNSQAPNAHVLNFNSGTFLSPAPPTAPPQAVPEASAGEPWNIYREFPQQQAQ